MKPRGRHDEEERLRSVALQNAQQHPAARQRAEEELLRAKRGARAQTRELDAVAGDDAGDAGIHDRRHPRHRRRGRITDVQRAVPADLGPAARARSSDAEPSRLRAQVTRQFADRERFVDARRGDLRDRPAEATDMLDLLDGRTLRADLAAADAGRRRTSGRVWSYPRHHRAQARSRRRCATRRACSSCSTRPARARVHARPAGAGAGRHRRRDRAERRASSARSSTTRPTTSGEAYLLYTLSGAPREAFEHFGHPRATPVFGPTFRGEGVVRIDDVLTDPRYGQMGAAPRHAARATCRCAATSPCRSSRARARSSAACSSATPSRACSPSAPSGSSSASPRRPRSRSTTRGSTSAAQRAARGARAAARERARGARRGRARQRDEGRVPRHALARAAHAAQRDPRLGADAARRAASAETTWRRGSRRSSATRARRRSSSRTCST